jgi:hypothetical protein
MNIKSSTWISMLFGAIVAAVVLKDPLRVIRDALWGGWWGTLNSPDERWSHRPWKSDRASDGNSGISNVFRCVVNGS